MLGFKLNTMGVKRKEFCYAGDWSISSNLETGITKQCYCSNIRPFNVFENIDKPVKFVAIGNNCRTPHCRNSHMLLALGTIPHLNTTYYEVIRNRVCTDGTEWLSPQVKAFLSSKLEESNVCYSTTEKVAANIKNRGPYSLSSLIRPIIPKNLIIYFKRIKQDGLIK